METQGVGADIDEMTLPEAALAYASHGVPVFPCRPRAKEPLTEGGFHAATTDTDRIRSWWGRWPDANIAVPTGPASGWLAVDIDPRNGGDATIEGWIRRYGRWPDTAEATTGSGGKHVLFRHADGLRCGPLAAGVDLKADGGYVIVAPSVHPNGKRYSWDGLDGADSLAHLVDPPGWLLRLARERRKAPPTGAPATKIPRGRRNQELASIAGVLRARGADVATLIEVLATANWRLCDPPLTDDEVTRIAESVARYDPQARPDDPAAQRIFEMLDEGRYVLRLPGIASELEVDRLRRDGGALTGELTARCWLPGARGVDGVLSIAEFNLSSARARTDRAKLIASRAQTVGVDWVGIVEELSQRVLLAERDGGPAIDLADIPLPDPDDRVKVDGFAFPRRHPSVIFGDGSAAKSYLGLYLAGKLVQQGLHIMFADWELAGEDHRLRLNRMFGDLRGISYLKCERPLVYEADRLRRIVREDGIDYGIFDSIAYAADGPPEAAEVAGRYFRAVREIGTGSLHIAHISRQSLDNEKKPFGSTFWHNGARATWFVKKTDPSADESRFSIGLFPRKYNLGPFPPPVGFSLTFTETQTIFRRTDIGAEPDLASKMSLADRIKSLLTRGPLTRSQIADELEVPLANVSKTIARKYSLFIDLDGKRVGVKDVSGDEVDMSS